MDVTSLTTELAAWADFIEAITGQAVRLGMCTCCHEPRPMVRYGPEGAGEWGHADDWTFAEVRHVHVESQARDCDGLYDHGHTYRIPSIIDVALRPLHLRAVSGSTPDFGDLWLYLVRHEPPLYRDCELRIEDKVATWHATTDEGWEGGELRVCDDPGCAFDGSEFRDHTAESEGY